MEKIKDINFKYNLKKYWSFLKNYKLSLVGVLLISLIIAASYTATKFLFKLLIDNGTEFYEGTLSKEGLIEILIFITIAYFTLKTLTAILRWLHVHFINKLETGLIKDVKIKYFDHIVHLSHDFHTSNKTGSLISRVMRGGFAMERMTDIIAFNTAPLLFQTIMVVGALLLFNWQAAIAVLLTIIIFIIFSYIMQNHQRKANILVNETEDLEKGNLSDFMTNIDSIKYFGKEARIKRKFANLVNETRKAMLKHWNYYRWIDAGQGVIITVGLFFLMYFPIIQFLEGNMKMGTIVFIYAVYGDLMGPLFGFVHGMRNYYRAMADFESLFQYGKIKNSIKNKLGAKKLKIKRGEIEFKNIDFSYNKKQKLLKNFSLKIKKNEKIAFVGHSGSGKSTLIKLLYRLYDVDKGAISIDNEDIRNIKQESLRSELSIVPQECILFDDTIYNNVAFSNPKATRKEVIAAMKFAQLYQVVKEFPKQEKTIVGERGVKLSGGEKQRVSIARAILANKKILVLDEATSALDSQTEFDIQRDLTKLMEGRTSLIIAHRLSTIMKADKIIVLNKGEIVQVGKHTELIKKPGQYRKLWKLQKGGYIN
ncbi:ABC transporter ATP-binding protein [archaeon]|jgi:ATP-binding cassette, subfamily B, heavy metal transporter|nr:ABC transporter ATP-binding protein [archaeon]